MSNHYSRPDVPDPNFSKLRALDVPPEAVVSRRIRDALANVDESFSSPWGKRLGLLLTMSPLALYGVMVNEIQLIALRKEIRQLRGGS